MATTNFKGNPVTTSGELPAVGSVAPRFELVGADLRPFTSESFAGERIVLNIFPSVDTGVCAQSVRTFNEKAADLDNTVVVCASKDLPFALTRFCGVEGIENVVTGSAFRTYFGEDYGVVMENDSLQGLFARSIVVIDTDGTVLYTQLVPEVTTEPDYDAALAVL